MSPPTRAILFFVLALLLLNSFCSFRPSYRVFAESVEVSGEANLHVYVIDLNGVGNRWVANRSKVVDGALQAAGVRTLTVPLFERFERTDLDQYVKVNVTVTTTIVTDWDAYRSLVETGTNTIIVNAHDEYLPIPTGYSREQWVGRIADFMLNRSGTWVHTGGYPMNSTWFENGSTEVWGEGGFQTLMGNVGKENVDCKVAPNQIHETSTFSVEATQWLALDFWTSDQDAFPINTFHGVNTGYPLKFDDFGDYLELPLYENIINGKLCWSGASIRFSQEAVASKFGIYVHLGSWEFRDGGGDSLNRFADLAMGYVTTATAIWTEVYLAVGKFYEASDAIDTAKQEGRISRLMKAESLLQQAAEAYNSSSFKMSAVYAEKAAKLANESSSLSIFLITAGAVITGLVATSLIFYRRERQNMK